MCLLARIMFRLFVFKAVHSGCVFCSLSWPGRTCHLVAPTRGLPLTLWYVRLCVLLDEWWSVIEHLLLVASSCSLQPCRKLDAAHAFYLLACGICTSLVGPEKGPGHIHVHAPSIHVHLLTMQFWGPCRPKQAWQYLYDVHCSYACFFQAQ